MTESTTDPDLISAAEFHAALGESAWRVTASGPQATFAATSLRHAASILDVITSTAERLRLLPDVDVRPEAVVIRIPHRGLEGIPAAAPAFAAEVSSAADALGLTPEPDRNQSIMIYVAQHSRADVRPFFLAALGYEPLWDADGVDPLRVGPQLAFNPITGDAAGRGRSHFDVYVPADQAQARVDAALAAGGRLADDSYAPMWWSLASPDNHGVDIAAWPDARA